jgi:hypothetical protein
MNLDHGGPSQFKVKKKYPSGVLKWYKWYLSQKGTFQFFCSKATTPTAGQTENNSRATTFANDKNCPRIVGLWVFVQFSHFWKIKYIV